MVTRRATSAEDLTDKHVVINCRTGEVFACDTHNEAISLAAQHAEEANRAAGPVAPPPTFPAIRR